MARRRVAAIALTLVCALSLGSYSATQSQAQPSQLAMAASPPGVAELPRGSSPGEGVLAIGAVRARVADHVGAPSTEPAPVDVSAAPSSAAIRARVPGSDATATPEPVAAETVAEPGVPQIPTPAAEVATAEVQIPPAPAGVPEASHGVGMTAPWSEGTYIAWIKDQNRAYFVADNVIIRVAIITDNDAKTPVGDYAIYTHDEWTLSVPGLRARLNHFMGFYRRPGVVGNIGFHQIGVLRDGSDIQDPSTLGMEGYVSDGCVRLTADDAAFAFDFATIGTPVIVR